MLFRKLFVLLCAIGATRATAPRLVTAQQIQFGECIVGSLPDSDHDGLSDECELRLARDFAPVLVVRAGGCNWDDESHRLAGGYFFAVQPSDGVIRIAYLPAYFKDCGWSGVKCWLPRVECAPHDGDSEFMVVELRVRGDSVSPSAVFLSSHCFGRYDKNCRWYRGAELQLFQWQRSAPVIWVAEGRHANYPSRKLCDKGLHSIDTCDHNETRYRFPIVEDRNIGSRDHPQRHCISGSELADSLIDSEAIECFWEPDRPFKGWHLNAPGITGYHRYLTQVAGF